MFVVPGVGVKKEISSMPGQYHLSVDMIVEEAAAVRDLGIPAIILFGLPEYKDETGSSGALPDGVVQQALRGIKSRAPDLTLITDVCLCEYTSHGHCGVLREGRVGQRPHPGTFGPTGPVPRRSRRGHGGPLGHDGRPGGRHSADPWTRAVFLKFRS